MVWRACAPPAIRGEQQDKGAERCAQGHPAQAVCSSKKLRSKAISTTATLDHSQKTVKVNMNRYYTCTKLYRAMETSTPRGGPSPPDPWAKGSPYPSVDDVEDARQRQSSIVECGIWWFVVMEWLWRRPP